MATAAKAWAIGLQTASDSGRPIQSGVQERGCGRRPSRSAWHPEVTEDMLNAEFIQLAAAGAHNLAPFKELAAVGSWRTVCFTGVAGVQSTFYGPLVVPFGVNQYDLGLFQTSSGPLYVNAGIGYFHLNVRFNCRPEITVFEM